MPTRFDNSYQRVFNQPDFESEQQKEEEMIKKTAKYIIERRPPPLPTREEELEYLNFLEKSFKSDPIIPWHFRKYTPGPRRIHFKRKQELWNKVKLVNLANFLTGAVLTLPLAILAGKRFKRTSGGVPIVHNHVMYPDFPNVEPTKKARMNFYFGMYAVCALGGLLYMLYWRDLSPVMDEFHNRPDFKPYPAMVREEKSIAYEQLEELYYDKQANAAASTRWKQSLLYRFFFPNSADYNIKREYNLPDNCQYLASRPGVYPGKQNHFDHTWN